MSGFGAWYHVSGRGNERRDIFREDRDRLHFCKLLGQVPKRGAEPELQGLCGAGGAGGTGRTPWEALTKQVVLGGEEVRQLSKIEM